MRLLARVFVVFLLLLPVAYCLLPIQTVHAQYPNPYIAPNTDSTVPANLHTYTQSILLEVLSAITCQIIGQDPTTASHACLGFDPSTGKIGYVNNHGGALGFVDSMVTALYTPPASSTEYLHAIAGDFGIVKHVFAASPNGIGFDRLSPLLGLWTTFRNITYLAFVIIFIGIGFAIMLRVKIDPRTVMTIENQIPKIIIGLLLVTFSYAIAGFLIDMMYVSTYLTFNVITNADGVQQPTKDMLKQAETNDLAGGNPLGFMNDAVGFINLTTGSAAGVSTIVNNLLTSDVPATSSAASIGVSGAVGAGSGLLAGAAIGGIVGSLPGAVVGGIIGAIAGGIAGLVAGTAQNIPQVVANAFGTLISILAGLVAILVISIALLVAMFRVWFSLLLAYIMLLLEIVLAPFYIIIGLFPGSKVGFGSWFRSMVGNLLAFPATVAMFVLAKVFMDNFSANSYNVFVPPLIGNVNGVIGQNPLADLIGLGMILLTPSVVQMTRAAVGAPDNKFLAGIFQGVGIGGKATGGIFKQTFGALFGNEIKYNEQGQIETLKNPFERLRHQFVRKVGG